MRHRPRTSTLVLGAVFVATLVLYLAVRPDPPPPAGEPRDPGPTTTAVVREPDTTAPPDAPSADTPDGSTTTTPAGEDDPEAEPKDGSTSTTAPTTRSPSTSTTVAEDGDGQTTG